MAHRKLATPNPWALNVRERWSTGVLALLVALTSAAGLLIGEVYAQETPAWRTEAHGQDIANLLSVPVLLVAGHLAGKGSARARHVWTGVLLFVVYAYAVYAFDVHFNRLFLAYLATLGLAGYTLLPSVFKLSLPPNASRTSKDRLVGAFLILVSLLFALLWLSEEIPAAVTGVVPASVPLPRS
jgi:hypothetical protein